MNALTLYSIALLSLTTALKAQTLTYLYPKPGSSYHNPTTVILARSTSPFQDIKTQVRGSVSGIISTELKISDSKSILNIVPVTPFAPGETVTVQMRGGSIDTSFTFNVATDLKPSEVEVQEQQADNVFGLDEGFPTINITTQKPGVYGGHIYIAPNSRVQNPLATPHVVITDSVGVPVNYKAVPEYPFDIRVLPSGQIAYTVFQTAATGARASSVAIILDTNLNVKKQYSGGFGYPLAQHGFSTLSNGNRLQICQENFTMNMSQTVPGGNPAATMQQSIFQEVDPRGLVLFQWRALDHIPVTASYEDLTAASIRFSHLNAVWPDDDGNLLMSLRHLSSIAKVNRNTGEFMWIMGGKLNQFTFIGEDETNAPFYFSYQHDIRRLPNGNISMFDNGQQKDPQISRSVEYKIDEVAKTATFVWDFKPNPPIYVTNQGAVQTLPNGNRIMTWGVAVEKSGTPAFTEVNNEGEVVLEGFMPLGMSPYKVEKNVYPAGRNAAVVFVDEILKDNTYKYIKGKDSAGVTVTYHTMVSFFYNSTEAFRKEWAPIFPEFEGTAPKLANATLYMMQQGIDSHAGTFRFNTETLRLGKDAPLMKVYRRDKRDEGVFVELNTRYNSDTKELIVDTTSMGEFAFGLKQDYPVPPLARLISPVGGVKVSAAQTILRVSPQGQRKAQVFRVFDSKESTVPMLTKTTPADKDTLTGLTNGKYYWSVATIDDKLVEGNETQRDSFEVTNNFIEIFPPKQLNWSYDKSYAIEWNTNILSRIKIELVSSTGTAYLVRDSVVASNKAFLWTVTVNVPVGTGYRVRISTVDGSEPGTVLSEYPVNIQPTSIEDSFARETSVSPNPASATVFISGTERISEVSIFNIHGEKLSQQLVQGTGTTLQVDALPNGTYYVLLSNGVSQTIKSLVVVH